MHRLKSNSTASNNDTGGEATTFMNFVLFDKVDDTQPLPITIMQTLPRLRIEFGAESAYGPCLALWAIIDTVAALCTGKLVFFVNLCKCFPHIVDKIIVSGESTGFTPIGLSGIICPDVDKETTSLLPVLFYLKLKYKDASGKPCLLRVASGKSVAVNFLLGLPFLKKAKATVCFESDRFHCPAFDGDDPFTTSYRTPTLSKPKVLFHHSVPTSSNPYEKDVFDAIVSVMAAFDVPGVKNVVRLPF